MTSKVQPIPEGYHTCDAIFNRQWREELQKRAAALGQS